MAEALLTSGTLSLNSEGYYEGSMNVAGIPCSKAYLFCFGSATTNNLTVTLPFTPVGVVAFHTVSVISSDTNYGSYANVNPTFVPNVKNAVKGYDNNGVSFNLTLSGTSFIVGSTGAYGIGVAIA